MRPDIARTRPQQTACNDLLDGMCHPADTAADGEQRKGTAVWKPAMFDHRGKRDINGPEVRIAVWRVTQSRIRSAVNRDCRTV
jgi:hypothetical protein